MAHFLIMVGIAFDVFFVIIGGGSSCGFGVRVVVALYKGSESVPSVSGLWNNFTSIAINSSLKVWLNSVLNPSDFFWFCFSFCIVFCHCLIGRLNYCFGFIRGYESV